MTYHRKWRVINPDATGSVMLGGVLVALLDGHKKTFTAETEVEAIRFAQSGHFNPVEGSDAKEDAPSADAPADPAEKAPPTKKTKESA